MGAGSTTLVLSTVKHKGKADAFECVSGVISALGANKIIFLPNHAIFMSLSSISCYQRWLLYVLNAKFIPDRSNFRFALFLHGSAC